MPQRSGRRQKTAGRKSARGMGAGAGREMSVIQKYLEPQREREREIQRRKKEIMVTFRDGSEIQA